MCKQLSIKQSIKSANMQEHQSSLHVRLTCSFSSFLDGTENRKQRIVHNTDKIIQDDKYSKIDHKRQ